MNIGEWILLIAMIVGEWQYKIVPNTIPECDL